MRICVCKSALAHAPTRFFSPRKIWSHHACLMFASLLVAGCAADLPVQAATPPAAVQPAGPVRAEIDPSTLHTLNRVLDQVSNHRGLSAGHLIKVISAEFLGTPY